VLVLQAVFVADCTFDTDELLDGDDIFPDPPVLPQKSTEVRFSRMNRLSSFQNVAKLLSPLL